MYETTPLKDLQAELGETAETGLSENEAKTRLEKYGRNTLAKTKRKSVFMHILCSFKDVTIIILCVAMALSLYIALTTHPDNLTEPIVIAFIIVLNIFLSVREQVKAEKSVESLKKYNIQKCTVIRAGKTDKIDAELLVPGDIITLSTGDRVPADARILEETGLCCDESLLTGESEPATKDISFMPEEDTAAGVCSSAASPIKKMPPMTTRAATSARRRSRMTLGKIILPASLFVCSAKNIQMQTGLLLIYCRESAIITAGQDKKNLPLKKQRHPPRSIGECRLFFINVRLIEEDILHPAVENPA